MNRVPLTCVSQASSSKSKNVIKKTTRISIKLPQSDENTCPEFNYQDELDAVKRKASKNTENGRIPDILDDDDDVRRIAKEMEEKYGNKVSNVPKKKRKKRRDDYADIGMGYDESDSFIDNTDGYDEIIPQNVETLLGGFYINSGALEFKTGQEESDDSTDDASNSSSGSRKRSLSSEGSEDEEEKDQPSNKKIKVAPGENGMQKALKKKLFSPNKILKKKKPTNVIKKTVSELLKEKRKDLNLSTSDCRLEVNADDSEAKQSMENGKVSNSITDAIESVVKASEDNVRTAEKVVSSQANDIIAKPVTLPENLPKSIINIINSIKEKSENYTNGDKFTKEINHLLTSFERKCKFIGKPSKYKVYENLSYYLKVEKQVLIQHCNQLALKDDQNKIESLLRQLKAEIDKVMPSIVQSYERDCELVVERRNMLQQQNPEGDEKRKIGRPKRKFQWNDTTRKFLKDTATIKKRSFLNQNNSIDSWEEELTTFLKNKVIHLWPEGWMTMTALTKVCNKLFSEPNAVAPNQAGSSSRKESNKITATNTPNLPYPNISITPVVNNITPKASIPERIIDGKRYPLPHHKLLNLSKGTDDTPESSPEQHYTLEKSTYKEKKETVEYSTDKKNNNADTFFKVDYDKIKSTQPSPKPVNLDEAKLPNVSIIEIDGPTDFSNILPKTKFVPKNEAESPNSSNRILSGESSGHKKDNNRTLIINNCEVTPVRKQDEMKNNQDGDDIQKVMEHLKTLQQMSSPVKPFDGSYSNSGFSQKTSSLLQNDVNLVTTNFQDEYQKQLLNALGTLSASTSKSNYKCS